MVYIPVREQLVYTSRDCPSEQVANVEALVQFEDVFWRNSVTSGKMTLEELRRNIQTNYIQEDPQGVATLFANGKCIAWNNLRGIPGARNNHEDENPGSVYLVHLLGSKVDFNFVDRLPPAPNSSDFEPRYFRELLDRLFDGI
jgi:hypothetical protein